MCTAKVTLCSFYGSKFSFFLKKKIFPSQYYGRDRELLTWNAQSKQQQQQERKKKPIPLTFDPAPVPEVFLSGPGRAVPSPPELGPAVLHGVAAGVEQGGVSRDVHGRLDQQVLNLLCFAK